MLGQFPNPVVDRLICKIFMFAFIFMFSGYTDLEMFSFLSLGSLSVRLGHVFYNKSEDEQAIPFYSTSCQQLALWCQADPDKLSSRIKEVLVNVTDILLSMTSK